MIWIFLFTMCGVQIQSLFLPDERSSLDGKTKLVQLKDRCNTVVFSISDCKKRFFDNTDSWFGTTAVGGVPAKHKEFTHMAAIGWTQPNGGIRWECGGSLVWYDFVLTAAHCVLVPNSKPPDVVRLGDIDITSSDDDACAQQFRIIEIFRHPAYRATSNYHDIALLKLDQNVEVNSHVIPACLWTAEELKFEKLVSLGWGRTGYGKKFSPNLLKVSLKPISTEECKKYYPADRKLQKGLMDHQLCAVDKEMDTCDGDSGGPLLIKLMHNHRLTPFIVGITSFGSPCGLSIPGVYTRVSTYFKWIIETMRQNGAELEGRLGSTTTASVLFFSMVNRIPLIMMIKIF